MRRRIAHTYHQEIGLGPLAILSLNENAASCEVFGEWHAQMGIIEDAQVLQLRRIGGANLAGLDFELRLSQASTLNEDLIYGISLALLVAKAAWSSPGCDIRGGACSSSSMGLRFSGRLGLSIAVACVVYEQKNRRCTARQSRRLGRRVCVENRVADWSFIAPRERRSRCTRDGKRSREWDAQAREYLGGLGVSKSMAMMKRM